MIDLTFASARAYNYCTPDNEIILGFAMHEVAGEPGTFRFVVNGYHAATGMFDRIYSDSTVDVYGIDDMHEVLKRLFNAADKCIRDAYVCFDVFYGLTDANGDRWCPMRWVGYPLLAAAFEHEGVDCYPLTMDDVKRLVSPDTF